MPTTLTYFDFEASRGLECRLALHLAGVPFTDNRIKRDEWMQLKPTLPFGALPVLSHEGRELSQSTAILNFIGRAHGLVPTDPWTAAEHDALMHGVEDLRNKVPGGRGKSDDEKKAAREAFAAGWLTRWAETMSARIQGPFLEGDALHVADLKLFVILRAYLAGGYDFIPASFFDAFPALTDFVTAVEAHPAIAAYFAARG